MDTHSQVYAALNEKWKSTARVLLGGDIGNLEDCAEWLYSGNGPRQVEKSSISGKEVVFSIGDYPNNSRRLSLDEVDFHKQYSLETGKIRNFGSLANAVSDRVFYTGNIVLGNSKFIEKSTHIYDSFYIYETERMAFSKYAAYCTFGSYGENMYGCFSFGDCGFCIKSTNMMYSKRCFSSTKLDNCSDCYYSHGLSNCQDCIFCFNLKNKRYAIGNVVLPREKYLEIKGRMLSEFREKLIKEKKLPSLIELIGENKPDFNSAKKAALGLASLNPQKPDKKHVENAFSSTFQVIFGKAPGQIDTYSKWLSSHVVTIADEKSCLSGQSVIIPIYPSFSRFPRDCLVSQREADLLGEKMSISKEEAEGLCFANAGKTVSRIAFYSPEWDVGNSTQNIDCTGSIDSSFCYKDTLGVKGKLCAFCFLPRNSEHLFGCSEGRASSFCINCYRSTRLSRCFEVDSSNDCSDCYFCHNCENVQNGILCFNVKNKKYAVGNVEVGREKFMEIKKMMLEELNKKLEKGKMVEMSIFNLC